MAVPRKGTFLSSWEAHEDVVLGGFLGWQEQAKWSLKDEWDVDGQKCWKGILAKGNSASKCTELAIS